MEAEFVSIFVDKQREVIVDLTSRNIMLDARIMFAEQKLAQMKELADELEANKDHVNQLTAVNKQKEEEKQQLSIAESRLKGEMVDMNKELEHLKIKVKEYKIDADQLRDQVKKLNLEKEANEAKTARLKSKAKQLAEE
jgi:chromosome segregation ATPase